MAGEIVGHVQCPFCLSRAPVRTNKSERRYVSCPVCGPIQAHGASVQDWIADNLEDDQPAAQPELEEEPAAAPAEPAPRKQRPWLIGDDDA